MISISPQLECCLNWLLIMVPLLKLPAVFHLTLIKNFFTNAARFSLYLCYSVPKVSMRYWLATIECGMLWAFRTVLKLTASNTFKLLGPDSISLYGVNFFILGDFSFFDHITTMTYLLCSRQIY